MKVVAAFESEADFNFASCKYDNFKKLTASDIKKYSELPLWECGINTADALKKQKLVKLQKVSKN